MTVGIDYVRLRRVREQIIASPGQFSMTDWVSNKGHATCIGGLAAIDAGFIALRESQHPETFRYYDVTDAGSTIGEGLFDEARFRVALNLTPDEADRLFDVERWPQPFYVDYAKAQGADRADVAARRIDLFIRTRGHQ